MDEVQAPPEIPPVLQTTESHLCGSAGTGKTCLARAMVEQLPGSVLAATTGIASVNLGEGTTINALLGYFDTRSLQENHFEGRLSKRLMRLYKAGLRRIILDEVSMMDAEQLTTITQALDDLRGTGYIVDDDYKKTDITEPLALTLVGDFAQLPPVKAAFAFESPEWHRYAANTHKLTKIWRQEDEAFISALQAARRGEASPVVDYFGPRLHGSMDMEFEGSTILAKNEQVDRFNALRMRRLNAPAHLFPTLRWGTQRGDWKGIPNALQLKKGALVMVLANMRDDPPSLTPKLRYANGDLGHVTHLDADRKEAWVRLVRNDAEVSISYVTRPNLRTLDNKRRAELEAEDQEHLISGRYEIIGEVNYLPLRVAYATTVHKSQGLSLDRVQVNTKDPFFHHPGLLYVALSRARTAEGLRLIGSATGLRRRCTVHPKVAPWV